MDIRGVYGFSSLMKQKIKSKNYALLLRRICSLNFLCCEVILKQKIYKRSTNHY
jgi:hypothetical protein